MTSLNVRYALPCFILLFSCFDASSDEIEVNKLPKGVADSIHRSISNGIILSASNEWQSGKEYYIVNVLHVDNELTYYISPDGDAKILRRNFTIWENVECIFAFFPCILCGLTLRITHRVWHHNQSSPAADYLYSWLGSAVAIGGLLLISPVDCCDRNPCVILIICIVWALFFACVIEMLYFAINYIYGFRGPAYRPLVIVAFALASFATCVAIDFFRIDRINHYSKQQVANYAAMVGK